MKCLILVLGFLLSSLVFSDHVIEIKTPFSEVQPFVMAPEENLKINYILPAVNIFNIAQIGSHLFSLTGVSGIVPKGFDTATYNSERRILNFLPSFLPRQIQIHFSNSNHCPLQIKIMRGHMGQLILNASLLLALEDSCAEFGWEQITYPDM